MRECFFISFLKKRKKKEIMPLNNIFFDIIFAQSKKAIV
jgi:hypothetical protein